jgi:hypothetical protein
LRPNDRSFATVGVVNDPLISPAATEEEAVAIMAAVEALWPRPMAVAPVDQERTLAWRFSGRWWQRDRFAHASRPWS